jgi:hypothetical protein
MGTTATSGIAAASSAVSSSSKPPKSVKPAHRVTELRCVVN